jgi:hypothetical protein
MCASELGLLGLVPEAFEVRATHEGLKHREGDAVHIGGIRVFEELHQRICQAAHGQHRQRVYRQHSLLGPSERAPSDDEELGEV